MVFSDEVVCEFVRISLRALVFLSYGSSQVMVELVKNDERIPDDITVEDRDCLVFGSVAAEDVFSVSLGQAYSKLGQNYSVMLCQKG